MFGLFKKRPAPNGESTNETHVDVALGGDFSDLTTVELCDVAVVEGRIEPFLLLSERFGGERTGPNVVLGPRGSAAAKEQLDREVVAAVDSGVDIDMSASVDYGDGASRVPRTVRFELGPLGTRVLHLWG